jgi:hypothetical protein
MSEKPRDREKLFQLNEALKLYRRSHTLLFYFLGVKEIGIEVCGGVCKLLHSLLFDSRYSLFLSLLPKFHELQQAIFHFAVNEL